MHIKGDRVRQLRKTLGLSQEELAEAVAIDQTQISDYERSKGNPTASSLVGLADALGTSADYLLGRTDDPTPLSHNSPQILKPKERLVIEKWRSGEVTEAIKIMLGE